MGCALGGKELPHQHLSFQPCRLGTGVFRADHLSAWCFTLPSHMVKSTCLLENEPIKAVEWAKMMPEGRVLAAASGMKGGGLSFLKL